MEKAPGNNDESWLGDFDLESRILKEAFNVRSGEEEEEEREEKPGLLTSYFVNMIYVLPASFKAKRQPCTLSRGRLLS